MVIVIILLNRVLNSYNTAIIKYSFMGGMYNENY